MRQKAATVEVTKGTIVAIATARSLNGLRLGDSISIRFNGSCRAISFTIAAMGGEGEQQWVSPDVEGATRYTVDGNGLIELRARAA